jgi:hypothetical protein
MTARIAFLASLFLLPACSSSRADTSAAPAPGAAAHVQPGWDTYGAGTDAAGAVPVARVLANPSPHLGKPVKIRGPIVGTCPKKGCWMRMGSEGENVFVKFKDYGFFVPTAGVEGRDAVVAGELKMETQSADEVKHYLEDAGKHEEAAKVTSGRQVLSFVATGVAIEQKKQS